MTEKISEKSNLINFYVKFGLLVEFESLVSCQYSEAFMLSDHIKAINYLNYIFIHLPDLSSIDINAFHDSLFQMDFEKYVSLNKQLINY